MATIKTEYGWTAHSHHLKAMLGLNPRAKLPVEGLAAQDIQGVRVWIRPLEPSRKIIRQHRVMGQCLTCFKTMSAGRLHQHTCRAG